MYLHLSVGVAIALGVVTLGSAEASAGVRQGGKIAPNSYAAGIPKSPSRPASALEPFYHQATWKNSRY